MKKPWIGLLAALIVLFVIPVGHAVMVLVEHIWPSARFLAAGILGVAGVLLLAAGVYGNDKPVRASLLGFGGAMAVWTGWIEFSFVWVAHKLQVAPLMTATGEVATKPEYLVMLSSLGLLGGMVLPFMFAPTRCQVFVWWQKVIGIRRVVSSQPTARPMATIVFLESISLVWFFYVVLLLVYDEEIAGEYHPATWMVAFGSLLWSLYLIRSLLRISEFSYALRYAIPTVIIFWNFIEVLGRWEILNELWIKPVEHWRENTVIALILVSFLVSLRWIERRK